MNDNIINAFAGNEPINSNIMMIGVGGAGCNIVESMYQLGIHNVMFMVCNTDTLALNKKSIPLKITLGAELTSGLGAGANPTIGRNAAIESEQLIRKTLEETGTQMAFIGAGMGGGTGTGAAPIIAKICQEMGILTVGFVTVPQRFEGPKRMQVAMEGLHEIANHLDSIIIVDNQAVVENHGNLRTTEQFAKANEILAESAKGVAEIITIELFVNVDFSDVCTTMKKSGITLLGTSVVKVTGKDNFVDKAMDEVLNSSLLMQNDISGAKNILLNISWGGEEPLGDDVNRIMELVQSEAGGDYSANIIYGMGQDPNLGEDELKITVVATAFDTSKDKFGLFIKDKFIEQKVVDVEKPLLPKERIVAAKSQTKALNVGRYSDDNKVNIRKENIEHLKSYSINDIETIPAYLRYKLDVKFVPDSDNKKVVKL